MRNSTYCSVWCNVWSYVDRKKSDKPRVGVKTFWVNIGLIIGSRFCSKSFALFFLSHFKYYWWKVFRFFGTTFGQTKNWDLELSSISVFDYQTWRTEKNTVIFISTRCGVTHVKAALNSDIECSAYTKPQQHHKTATITIYDQSNCVNPANVTDLRVQI